MDEAKKRETVQQLLALIVGIRSNPFYILCSHFDGKKVVGTTLPGVG